MKKIEHRPQSEVEKERREEERRFWQAVCSAGYMFPAQNDWQTSDYPTNTIGCYRVLPKRKRYKDKR